MNLYAMKETWLVMLYSVFYRFTKQPYLLLKNKKKKNRKLELGPGDKRIAGFETMNLFKNQVTDYVGDCFCHLPFDEDTFDIVYASHILEHAPWYKLNPVLKEWRRVLKPGGQIEIWVPDGLKIAKAFVDAETDNSEEWKKDNWFRFNEKKDSSIWFAARMFSYGDGLGTRGHRNWHLATFSPRLLKSLLEENGFENITFLTHDECRGYDHGWINLGIRGQKPYNNKQ